LVNENGTALADGGALPSRFGTFYWDGGILHSAWVPSQTKRSAAFYTGFILFQRHASRRLFDERC
jgi:hypothetical protein